MGYAEARSRSLTDLSKQQSTIHARNSGLKAKWLYLRMTSAACAVCAMHKRTIQLFPVYRSLFMNNLTKGIVSDKLKLAPRWPEVSSLDTYQGNVWLQSIDVHLLPAVSLILIVLVQPHL